MVRRCRGHGLNMLTDQQEHSEKDDHIKVRCVIRFDASCTQSRYDEQCQRRNVGDSYAAGSQKIHASESRQPVKQCR